MIVHLIPSLLAVKVPNETVKFSIGGHCYGCSQVGLLHCAHADRCDGAIYVLRYHSGTKESEGMIKLPSGFTQLLGEPSEIQEGQLDGIMPGNNGGVNDTMWQDFTASGFAVFHCATRVLSLSRLLRSHEVYSVNPLGEKEPDESEYDNNEILYSETVLKWHHAQSRTGKWILIKHN